MSDPYSLHQTLLGYKSQINCISFSPNGEFLATGSEDGLLRVWNTPDGKELAFLEADSSITCLEWHPVRRKRLFFGCSGGSVMFADNFGKEIAQPIQTGIKGGIVDALSIDEQSDLVAISVGPEVHIARKLEVEGSYATFSILPEPKLLPSTTADSDPRVRAVSLKFIKHGSRLIVSYLSHGVVCWDVKKSSHLWRIVPAHEHCHIGNSMLSPDGHSLLVSNLSDAMNSYSLDTLNATKSYRYTINPRMNFPLAVAYLKRGKYVTCGTHTGAVQIWDRESGEIFQVLEHSSPFISCLAARHSNGYDYIATVITGEKPEVKIWRADDEQTSSEKIAEYLQHFNMWLDDNYNEKGSRDMILVVVVAIVTYFFTVYLQQPTGPASVATDTRLLTWTSLMAQSVQRWVIYALSVAQGMSDSIRQAIRGGIVDWLEIQPHEVHAAQQTEAITESLSLINV